jgi:hypothetical protein
MTLSTVDAIRLRAAAMGLPSSFGDVLSFELDR